MNNEQPSGFEAPDFSIYLAYGGYIVVHRFWSDGELQVNLFVRPTLDDVLTLVAERTKAAETVDGAAEVVESALRGRR